MNFLAVNFCQESMWPIVSIVRAVINIIKFGIPIILIIFGMLDLGKAVMAGKEDEMKKFQGTLIKRVIYAVVIFLVITIVQLVMSIVAGAGVGAAADEKDSSNWYYCFFVKEFEKDTNKTTTNNGDGSIPAESTNK